MRLKCQCRLPLVGLAAIVLAASARAADHPIVGGFERFYTGEKADLAKGGKLLLGELNCVSCHLPGDSNPIARKQAPILDGVANRIRLTWLRSYLSDPHSVKPGTTMPNLLADDPDKSAKVEALVHFLASTGTLKQQRADFKTTLLGRDTYSKVGCVACHGPRDLLGMPEKNPPNYVIPLGDLKAKYSIASLSAFLDNPLLTRPSGRMPHLLAAKDANEVANYLLQGVKVNLPQGVGSTTFAYYEGTWEGVPDFGRIKPNSSGAGAAFDLSPAKRSNDFGMRFEGYFKIEREGSYQFTTISDDGSRLSIDGKRVVDNDGVHPPQPASGKITLAKGAHKVVVDFFQGGGGAELAVEFEGPGISRQNFAAYVTPTEAALEKKAEPKKIVDENIVEFKPELIETGKKLFGSIGCANCHQLSADKKPIASELSATPEEKLKPFGGCLAEKPLKGTPFFGLSELQRKALAAAISHPERESKEPAAVIARTMTTLNCYACHARDKTGGATEDLNKYFLTRAARKWATRDDCRLPSMASGPSSMPITSSKSSTRARTTGPTCTRTCRAFR